MVGAAALGLGRLSAATPKRPTHPSRQKYPPPTPPYPTPPTLPAHHGTTCPRNPVGEIVCADDFCREKGGGWGEAPPAPVKTKSGCTNQESLPLHPRADVTDFSDVSKLSEDALSCIVPTLYGLLTNKHAQEYSTVVAPPPPPVLISRFGPELVGVNSASLTTGPSAEGG
jgi:hypothetical protein